MNYKIYGKHLGVKDLIADADSFFMSGLYYTFKHYYKKYSYKYMELTIEDDRGFEIFCKLNDTSSSE